MTSSVDVSAITRRGSYVNRPMKTNKFAVQGKRGESEDKPGFNEYSCSLHVVTYHIEEGRKAQCPVCEVEKSYRLLNATVQEMSRAHDMLITERDRYKAQSEVGDAMRLALDVADTEDIVMFKEIAYQWRSLEGDGTKMVVEPLLAMPPRTKNPRNRARRNDRRQKIIGFAVTKRNPAVLTQEYVLSSVGGLMVASLYADATKMTGWKKAMDLFMQAMAARLALPPSATKEWA